MDLELLAWGDGTIRLSYWDSMEGKDRVFILGDDGLAYVEIEESGVEVRKAVDLVAQLREMAQE